VSEEQDLDLAVWLRDLGLGRYRQAFCDAEVTLEILPELTDADLRELGLPLGPRKIVLKAIRDLAHPPVTTLAAEAAQAEAKQGAPLVTSQAERRQLTLMFVDLIGSTALTARLDPEDMCDVLRAYQNKVASEVARFEGHVAKYMGDGVLAYFGWPRAHEDEAERATRAGLAITAAVGRLSTPLGEPLAARIGIATGLVVVGDLVGEGSAQEEAVVGETPNLAARLQEVAGPGMVAVAADTRRLLGDVFELRELGPLRLKGFAHLVTGFQVLGEHPAGSRFEAQRPGRASPMVGRDQELALVRERWRQAAASEGQALLVVGDAGIGKSRLIYAALNAVAEDEHVALRYQCSPHHTGTALWPVVQQLKFAAGLLPTDTEAAKVDKLAGLLRSGAEEIDEAVQLIAPLLGIDVSARYPALELTPQQQRARTLAALVGQLLGLARCRPVLLVLEDAHWADPTTLELIGQTLDRIKNTQVLVLLTSRPDGEPRLSGHPHVTRLTLKRLGRGPTAAIITFLVGQHGLAPGVLHEIAARTDGVPLFVEELTKAVLEAGAAGKAAVPTSLNASLMARLDRVPGAKEVAQVAACLGREFGYPLLATVSRVPEPELRAALDQLRAAELVFVRGEPPDVIYTFKHALVRDAAYESLLRSRRSQLHARIAQVLEEHFPEVAQSEPELVARHFTWAGSCEKATAYWHKAGRRAMAGAATAEAIAHLTAGLQGLATLPESSAKGLLELDLQLALGGALAAGRGTGMPETGRAYMRAAALCRELSLAQPLYAALDGLVTYHRSRDELPAATVVGAELLDSACREGDAAAQIIAHMNNGIVCLARGELGAAAAHFRMALGLYDPARHGDLRLTYGYAPDVVCSGYLAWVLLSSGFMEQAVQKSEESLLQARKISDPLSLCFALHRAMGFHQLRADGDAVERAAEELSALAAKHGFVSYASYVELYRSWALARQGQTGASVESVWRALRALRDNKDVDFFPRTLAMAAEVLAGGGETAHALELVTEGLGRVIANEERWFEAELQRLWGQLLLASDPCQAERCYIRAIEVAREQGARLWELRAVTSLARLWRDQERQIEARDLLVPVHGWFTEGAETADLRAAKALLAELA
jgi:class 3 adenylate cyclase/predicted ATPase